MSPRLSLGLLAALVGHRIPEHLAPVAEALDKRLADGDTLRASGMRGGCTLLQRHVADWMRYHELPPVVRPSAPEPRGVLLAWRSTDNAQRLSDWARSPENDVAVVVGPKGVAVPRPPPATNRHQRRKAAALKRRKSRAWT